MTRCLHKIRTAGMCREDPAVPVGNDPGKLRRPSVANRRQPARQAVNPACIMSAAGNDAGFPTLREIYSMQRRILSGLAALAAALPLASHADVMDYSFAELGYVDTSLDTSGDDVDGNGFALRGSL